MEKETNIKELISISNLDKAITFIEKASVAQLEELISQAEMFRVYAIQSKKGLQLQNQASEIKIRAERKLSEWYQKQPKNKGGQLVAGVQPVIPTLKEMGLDKTKMYRLKELTNLPEADFEQHIAEVKKSNEELTTIGVLRLARKLQPKEKIEIPLPEGKYEVILADPPWDYPLAKSRKHINEHYPTMELQELCDLGQKIKELSADNCTLFLWATSGRLNWAFPVIEAWGFEYKSSLIWDKIKYNMGYYASIRHEFLLIAGKGQSTPRVDGKIINSIDSVQSIEKSSRHSEKPEEFRRIIETLYPNTKKIELFARGKASKGWDIWGLEALQ